MDRRRFLKLAGATAASASAAACAPWSAPTKAPTGAVSIVVDPADPVGSAPPTAWSVARLRAALTARGVAVRTFARVAAAPAGDLCVLVGGAAANPAVQQALGRAHAVLPASPEALGLMPGQVAGRSGVRACGPHPRGSAD